MAHILLADDHVPIASLLASRLRQRGDTLIWAPDGMRALTAVQTCHLNLILLDLHLPLLNGLEVLEYLKADPASRSIPVIILSACDDIVTMRRCFALGASDYLIKPIWLREVLIRISAVLLAQAQAAPVMPIVPAVGQPVGWTE